MDVLYRLIGQDSGDITWWQMCVRAAIVFAWGLLLVRVAGQRLFGKFAAFDIVVTVILGSVLSRALTGNARLLPAMAATALLVLLHWAVSKISWHWHLFGRITKGSETCLVEDGRIKVDELRRAAITEHELNEAIREKGLDRLDQVKSAYLERGGQISIVPRK